jgi:hypothetical protein
VGYLFFIFLFNLFLKFQALSKKVSLKVIVFFTSLFHDWLFFGRKFQIKFVILSPILEHYGMPLSLQVWKKKLLISLLNFKKFCLICIRVESWELAHIAQYILL